MRDRGAIVFFAMSFFLVACAASVATVIIVREGFGTNGAAWVQAGGSIAAIAGAVWLFRSDSVRRRRERRAAGEEVAWGVRFALTNAQFEARKIAAELAIEHFIEKENPRRHWLLQSKNCQNVLNVYANRTDHLHPTLNHIASNGVLLLQEMDDDIRKVCDGSSPEAVDAITQYGSHFEGLLQLLDERMRGILKALNEGGDSLPVRHLDVWKAP